MNPHVLSYSWSNMNSQQKAWFVFYWLLIISSFVASFALGWTIGGIVWGWIVTAGSTGWALAGEVFLFAVIAIPLATAASTLLSLMLTPVDWACEWVMARLGKKSNKARVSKTTRSGRVYEVRGTRMA